MKILVLALMLVILTSLSFTGTAADVGIKNPCLDQDVWVYVRHSDPFETTCTVIVHVPKHSLEGDLQNCPAQDTKLVGQGRLGFSGFAGFHIVTIKKGLLNSPKNYTTRAPRKIKVPANNFNTWHVSK